ncbi:MAG: transcription antitermination factor NusB [Lachnospiraceae bacterium]|nr:transcription antitermination factor NusB [Lachnospiraceae bacterium]
MTRHEIREEIMKGLFQANFYEKGEMDEQFANYFEDVGPFSEEDTVYIEEKSQDLLMHIDEIDAEIDRISEGWKTSRMAKVDLTILRIAVYEIKYEGLPAGVAINEAVELAKDFGSDTSSSFVNGILAKVAKEA